MALPRGGGALRSIGESFAANPVTGTATLSLPLGLSPGRAGFTPQLTLGYDSGLGNGPFGVGWSLGLPAVTRRSDRGLPQYDDAGESDVFLLAGSEDLVPALVRDGASWRRDSFTQTVAGSAYEVARYLPRVEGLFARIERWTERATGLSHWRTVSRDNITTLFGDRPEARIADPADPLRIFSWLIGASYDDRGNAAIYRYKAEDGAGVDSALPQEGPRVAAGGFAARLLKSVRYGNGTPRQLDEDLTLRDDWLFELVLDYGEHDAATPTPAATRPWPVRADPCSSYRAGFEVRGYRLCRRALMFHRFPAELGPEPVLVRSLDFGYAEGPALSFLTAVTQVGYLGNAAAGYTRKAMPPVELSYGPATIDPMVHTLAVDGGSAGLGDPGALWVDLDGEGLPGLLSEEGGAWFYRPNTGGALGAPRPVGQTPSPVVLAGGQQQLLDLAGDGRLDLVQLAAPMVGFFARQGDGGWAPFVPFASRPTLPWGEAHVRLVDLTGDGLADLLAAEGETALWCPSLAEAGFGAPRRASAAGDEALGPALVVSDGQGSIYLADLSGDGLPDLARIRNGEVCYWPNLGYGRFGARVSMADAPWFDAPDQFDGRRLRLADLDGTGIADLVYLGREGVRLWRNQAGNGWGPAEPLAEAIPADSIVELVDLRGAGTACLVWRSPLPGDAGGPIRFVDPLGGRKPHLLVGMRNNVGAETRLRYAPSTAFYLRDRAAGRPWATRLPFPVHVLERVEQLDWVSRTRLVSRFAYHHGHFDGAEREFRGFGMVEQWDSEELDLLREGGLFPAADNDLDAAAHVPPALTRTWFHTGVYLEGAGLARQYAAEYYVEPGLTPAEAEAMLLPDTILPAGLTPEEEREACRALRGAVLRRELYGLDGTPAAGRPYSVAERSYSVSLLQPRAGQRHAVCFAAAQESIDLHYERAEPPDPRVTHELILERDRFGNVRRQVDAAYGRRLADPELAPADQARQTATMATYAEHRYTNAVEAEGAYRTPMPCEQLTYELAGLAPGPGGRYTLAQLAAVAGLPAVAYEAAPLPGPHLRTVEHVRVLYRRDDLAGPLPLARLEALALPWERHELAFTPGLVAQVYGDRVDEALLAEAGYLHSAGDPGWWAPSGRDLLGAGAAARFFQPDGAADPFGAVTEIGYDSHSLLITRTEDAGGNVTMVRNNYRTLQPEQIADPNGNLAAVAFDELGMVVATAAMGKAGAADPAMIGDTMADPTTRTEYNLFAWANEGRPTFTRVLAREGHGAANQRWRESLTYFDGSGRAVQQKLQAEPDDEAGPGAPPRWIGSGWALRNNKGKLVRAFEPFFSDTPAFERREEGVSSTICYDPLGRAVATLLPNRSYQKVVVGPWRQATWDANDTCGADDPRADPDVGPWLARLDAADVLPTWRGARSGGAMGPAEQAAAAKALAHAGTPTLAHLDTLGRPFLTAADNGPAGRIVTRAELDIEGNQLAVIDPLGRVAMRTSFSVRGDRMRQQSVDAGERLTLVDAMRKPRCGWDARGRRVRRRYDLLQRQSHLLLREGDGPEELVERSVYGEAHPEAAALNLRGKLLLHLDGAGAMTALAYDFKGNLLASRYSLALAYKAAPRWDSVEAGLGAGPLSFAALAALLAPLVEGEAHASAARYDALNRPVALTTRDGSVLKLAYNEAGMPERVEASLRGAAAATPFVGGIAYNARGQRTAVQYANGLTARYSYDPQTFRLARIEARRGATAIQDLRYSYDAAGNITAQRDEAQQIELFAGAVVAPGSDYVYDAVYRLLEATGREGGAGQPVGPADDSRGGQPFPGAGPGLRRYTQSYSYDANGNLLSLAHTGAGGGWTRSFSYDEPNAAPASNRLTSTIAGGVSERYSYDAHGNISAMPHLAELAWDYQDQLAMIDRGGGGKVYFTYGSDGGRVRAVVERQSGTRQEERIYLGASELHRVYGGDGQSLRREEETLHVYDQGRRVAIVETLTLDREAPPFEPAPALRFQLDNHLGSSLLELDAGGQILAYEEYYPFGSTAYQAVRGAAAGGRRRYRFGGKERDPSGLSYHGARYGAPWLGRWISPDPAGLVDGPNLYAYTRNNPVNLVDPTGTESRHDELPQQALDLLSRVGIPEGGGESEGGGGLFDTIGNALSAIWEGIKDGVAAAWDWIKGAAETAWNWIKGAASSAWSWIKGAASSAWSWIKGAASTAWNWIKGAASTAWNWIKGAASTAWNWIKGAASTAWKWLKGAASWTWNWVVAPLVRTATNALAGFAVGGIAGAVVGAVTGAIHGWRMADAESYDWSSGYGWLMFLADNTWSLPNSAVGSVWATLNIWNPIDTGLSKGTGQLAMQKGWSGDYATTFGNVTAGRLVPTHERTHALQARIFGPLFYPSMLAHYVINTVLPYWLIYHKQMYPKAPINNFWQYFSRGVYAHSWAEEWAYAVEGSPP